MISLSSYPGGWGAALKAEIAVGIVQTNIDAAVAWRDSGQGPFRMNAAHQSLSWLQIRHALKALSSSEIRPDVILFPELSVPRSRLDELRNLAARSNILIIAGCDYAIDTPNKIVRNNAVIQVPLNWAKGTAGRGRYADQYFVGKTYPAPIEVREITKKGFSFSAEPNIFIFNTRNFGSFGVCICYDLMDLERALLYRGNITHLFVLAYNRDISSFFQLAESLSRAIYCNVVVCNTGFYGGSLATTMKYKPFQRTIYRHEGADLFAMQTVLLPVKEVLEAQLGTIIDPKTKEQKYKNHPPGYGGDNSALGIASIPLIK